MKSTKFTKPLSKIQGRLVMFIHDYIEKNNYPPTQKEMQEYMNIKSVNTQLTLIVKKGWLVREEDSQYRNIYLTDEGKKRIDTLRMKLEPDFDSS